VVERRGCGNSAIRKRGLHYLGHCGSWYADFWGDCPFAICCFLGSACQSGCITVRLLCMTRGDLWRFFFALLGYFAAYSCSLLPLVPGNCWDREREKVIRVAFDLFVSYLLWWLCTPNIYVGVRGRLQSSLEKFLCVLESAFRNAFSFSSSSIEGGASALSTSGPFLFAI
jgi:hypothetical protein